jgi:hypothetical protein
MRSAPKGVHNHFLRIDAKNPECCNRLKQLKRGTLARSVWNDRAGESMTAKRKASELLNEPTDKVNQPIDYYYV